MSPESLLSVLYAVAAARHLRVNSHSAVLGPDPTCASSLRDAGGNATDAAPFAAPNADATPSDASDDGASRLRPGSLVELYGDGSLYAIPSVVTGRRSAKYQLRGLLNDVMSVDPEFVHPYEIYGEGTEAYCNVGASPKIDMAPCRVESHFKKEGSPVAYHVVYAKEGRGEARRLLPYSKVLRRLTTSPVWLW